LTIDISTAYTPPAAAPRKQKAPAPPTFDELSPFGKKVHSLHQELVRLFPQFRSTKDAASRKETADPNWDASLGHAFGRHLGGDIVNSITGELIPAKDCMTPKEMAKQRNIPSKALTSVMKKHGLIDRVIDHRMVPVIAGSNR